MNEPRSRRLTSRLLAWYLVGAATLILVLDLALAGPLEAAAERAAIADLAVTARLIGAGLTDEPVGRGLSDLAATAGVEAAVVAPDGSGVAASGDGPAVDTPEMVVALEGGTASDVRVAEGGEERLFVAIPLDAGGAVQVSVPAARVGEEAAAVRRIVRVALLVLGAVGLVVVAVAARRVTVPIRELAEGAERLAEGDLEVPARRSRVAEVDRLGAAIGRIASELGRRIRSVDDERRTLETVLGALPQGVVLIGADDRIVYSNPSAAAMLGPVPDRAGLLVPRGINRSVRDARMSSAPVRAEVEHGAPARRLVSVATPFEDGVMLVVEDATERLRVEAMRRDFVADASHELKTPVAAIIASSEALELALEHDAARAKGFAHSIEGSARQLGRMIEDLLDLSRLETSDVPDHPVALDVSVERAATELMSRAARAQVDLGWATVPAVVRGSEADLGLAIRNLVENAIRYTDPGGIVRIGMRITGDRVEVSVADTGAGIPTRALERVFERFFRVDEARSRGTGGTGLGLAIVKHVSERHGGSVRVESQLGAGSTFTISLPLAERPTQG